MPNVENEISFFLSVETSLIIYSPCCTEDVQRIQCTPDISTYNDTKVDINMSLNLNTWFTPLAAKMYKEFSVLLLYRHITIQNFYVYKQKSI